MCKCGKCCRMPTLVILGVILTIILVFITGITLTNSINISNIVKLREKVASDSAAASSANAAQTRAALVEHQYSTLQQHHLSRSDLNYITANHPKNLQRFNLPTIESNAPLITTTAALHNTMAPNKIIIEIGVRNFSAASNASNVSSSEVIAEITPEAVKEQVVAPLSGAIIDGNIESISVPAATVDLQRHLNDSFASIFGKSTLVQHVPEEGIKTVANPTLTQINGITTSATTATSVSTTFSIKKETATTTTTEIPLWPLYVTSAPLELLTTLITTTTTRTTATTVTVLNDHQSSNESFINNSSNSWSKLPFSSSSSENNNESTDGLSLPNQLSIEDHNPSLIDFEKRNYVKKMMEHAWYNYKLYAWGKNELRPMSQRPHIGSIFGSHDLGATIIDGLDTLYIMGLEKEYKEGRDWIEHKFSLDNVSAELSVFETNIRFIGGLLTMYSFTGDNMYKDKAQHVADKLLPAFQTPTGIPYALVNPKTGISKNYNWASGSSSILSEFGTLHLEFSYLSDITGNPLYRDRVQNIRQVLKEIEKPNGLYPNFLNPKTGKWGQKHMSLGALGDSFYEYLLKAWLQSGQTDEEARQMFEEAMLAIIDKMVLTSRGGLTYVSDMKFERLEHKMDHLACFAGGLFALGANTRQNEYAEKFMEIGKGVTNTCRESYIRSTTRLGPEAFRFSEAAEARALKTNEKYYILRPETVESYFILWRLTHDQKYRDWGWDVVQALEQYCRTPHGYSGIRNVYQETPQKDDVQQSFFLAETLKYLYLLFSDDSLLSLDEWVFNTEAHPLPIKGANAYYRVASTTSVAAATNTT